MVDSAANVYSSFNQVYMTGLMTAPMVIIELVLMSAMYKNRKLNAVVIGFSGLALTACFALIRNQTAIGDSQFLRSMIPLLFEADFAKSCDTDGRQSRASDKTGGSRKTHLTILYS